MTLLLEEKVVTPVVAVMPAVTTVHGLLLPLPFYSRNGLRSSMVHRLGIK
jgi:hypothetical protein